ncbi:MAG: SAM-dependent methyltransferase [Clostridia bacterium]|nr:SAM-dependent methyltransferase [Clostridia bacterium]
MTDRLEKIFSVIPNCETFADIGCDHGYISYAMLKRKKCNHVIISDVSKECLKKAETLLGDYISSGQATAVVSDGFDNVGASNASLIAGMGGKEIIEILKRAQNLPDVLVLQPMKNTPEVRKTLVELGYKIVSDYIFKAEQKYYDLIYCERGKDTLTDLEIEFGRTNLNEKSQDFIDYVNKNVLKLKKYSSNPKMSLEDKDKLKNQIEKLEKCIR